MKKVKNHNESFVKKVDDIVNLFKWEHPLESDFQNLPSVSVLVDDTVVFKPNTVDVKAFNHHATVGYKFGKHFVSHTTHDYDEDAGGMYTNFHESVDGGETWIQKDPLMPQMSDMVDNGVNPSEWSYPSLFVDIPLGYFILINCVSSLSYTPVGVAVREIKSDGTYGDILWVKNPNSEESRVSPTPVSGYPSYAFAGQNLIDQVRFYIDQPENKPKILFGWDEIWAVQGSFEGNNLREPTTIRPYNYDEWLKVWRVVGLNYNVVQNGEDTATQIISEIPNATLTTAKRFVNFSPEIIVSVGHSKKTNREELMLFIARKNNATGQYVISDGDVYSVTPITKNAPLYPGAEKFGGEQLPFINLRGKYLLDIAFVVSKEDVYFKTVNLKELI